ncbi:MAG: DUF423 domain-containing protein [Saprospiraceae bacterium]|nr:DUF423 domain-containing protein [Saprospiraceae bacterium]
MHKLARFGHRWIALASILAAIAIGLGAFGAHGLEDQLNADQLSTFDTGVKYHFYHAFALLITALLSGFLPSIDLRWVVRLFLLGIVCFSGSLYLLSTASLHSLPVGILGPITPLGGLLLIMGWILLFLKVVRSTPIES